MATTWWKISNLGLKLLCGIKSTSEIYENTGRKLILFKLLLRKVFRIRKLRFEF